MNPDLMLNEGVDVVSADGNDLGTVDRLVIDPSAREVSHIVVSKGRFFAEERVVPVEWIWRADGNQVRLSEDADLESLPAFESEHYLPVDAVSTNRLYPTASGTPLVWGYPYGALAPGSMHGIGRMPRTISRTTRNIPSGNVAVETGAEVRTADGTKVGVVAGVIVDEDGRLTSFTVDGGWFKQDRVIPAHFVDRFDESEIRLALFDATLDVWRERVDA